MTVFSDLLQPDRGGAAHLIHLVDKGSFADWAKKQSADLRTLLQATRFEGNYYNDGQPTPTEAIELDLRVGGVWRQLMVIDEDTSYFTGGIYREIVPNERLVYAWGATGGWPRLDPDNLDESPQVTIVLTGNAARTEMVVHVELPAELPDDGVPAWWPMVENGFRDTIDRLAAELGRTRLLRDLVRRAA